MKDWGGLKIVKGSWSGGCEGVNGLEVVKDWSDSEAVKGGLGLEGVKELVV